MSELYPVTETYTCYQIAKMINKEFKSLGFKLIPTQQMYNYAKNGLLKTVDVDNLDADGNKKITQGVLIDYGNEFVARFVERRVERVNNS